MPKPLGQAVLVMLSGGPTIVFAPDPTNPHRYMRTDPSVLYAACPSCNAPRSVPCYGQQVAHTVSTHYSRRDAAMKAKRAGVDIKVLVGHGMRVNLKDIDL